MELKDYFENARGLGVIATADREGMVNTAVYARPHVLENDTIAFIMRNRKTRQNLLDNPNASYLFVEDGTKDRGKRLYLRMLREEKNSPRIDELQRRPYPDDATVDRFLVVFQLVKELPLLGPGAAD